MGHFQFEYSIGICASLLEAFLKMGEIFARGLKSCSVYLGLLIASVELRELSLLGVLNLYG